MPITSIQRDQPNNVSIVRITCTDTLATIAAPNYIRNETPTINVLNKGPWQWYDSDVLLFDSADGNAFFVFTDATFSSLILLASSTDGTVSPGLMDQIAYYALSGTTLSGTNTLPDAVQIHPANANNGVGATANTFWAGNDTWKTVSAATNHSIYPVYVSPDGSDITGNGSINAPYQSIQFAINSVTTASSSAQFQIICSYGVYNETTLTLKPWVSVEGRGSTLNVTGNIVQHVSWSSGGQISFGNFNEVNISGNVNLDFSSAIALPCFVRILDMNILTITGAFTVTGADALTLILSGLTSTTSSLNFSIENASGAIANCFFANLTYTASSFVSSYNFQLLNSISLGAVSFTSNVGAIGINSIIDNTKLFGTLTATGTNAFLSIDVASLTLASLPTLSGGANAAFINVSNTLTANYTPLNYLPDASGGTSPVTSVAAHLHGIDNQFAAMAAPAENYVYVSSTGSNITGNGTILDPFATVAHAMSTIVTASASNPFVIYLIGGTITETAQISLKPFVSIVGASNSVILSLFTFSILDPSWGSTANGTMRLSNFSWINADFILDASSFVNVTTSIIFADNLFSPTRSITTKGSADHGIETYVNNSILFGFVYSNSFVNLMSCIVSTVLCNPGLIDPPLRTQTGHFLGSRLNNVGISGALPFLTSATIYACQVSALSGTGAAVLLSVDTSSYVTPTLSSGATIDLNDPSASLSAADFTPTAYTPTATAPVLSTSLQGHLRGIDNALNAITAVESQTRYVSVLGSDLTGNGSIEKPYQTVAFAVASITTASSTNVFNVMLLDGVYTEAVQISLKPWVNLIGQSRNTTINNASDIILDSSWNSATNGTISIENLSIQNDLILDFTTVPTADGPIVFINNIQTDNLFIDGNTVNPNIFFIRNSFMFNPSFNNASVISFSNYYFTGFNSGTTAFTSSMNYFSNNDYYQSSVSLTGAAVGPTQQFFNIKNSSLNFTLTVTGAQATLNIDTDSYITPTLVGGAVLNLTSVSGGLSADFTPSFYTPTATAPTLSTSVQGHLRGIDNAIGSRTLVWNEVLGTSQAAAVNNAYITNNAGLVTVTLPATMAVGDRVAIQGKGAGGWSLVANAGQIINVGNTPTSVAGSASSTNQWDAIEIVCVTANTTWATRSMIGTLTIV